MANHEISDIVSFTGDIRKFETTDKVHADILNAPINDLVNNDLYLKSALDDTAQELKDYIGQWGGNYIGATAPTNTKLLWTDTSLGGVLKYFDGIKWIPLKAVWG